MIEQIAAESAENRAIQKSFLKMTFSILVRLLAWGGHIFGSALPTIAGPEVIAGFLYIAGLPDISGTSGTGTPKLLNKFGLPGVGGT